jgi:hypothetical protein
MPIIRKPQLYPTTLRRDRAPDQACRLSPTDLLLKFRLAATCPQLTKVDDIARALGIAPRTLKRARKKIGVIAVKSGMNGGTLKKTMEATLRSISIN